MLPALGRVFSYCKPPPTLFKLIVTVLWQDIKNSVKAPTECLYCCSILLCFLTRVPLLPIVRGLLTRVMVFVTPPTTVVTTWACWATVTAPDLCTVMMGLVVVGEDAVAVPTWAAAVFNIRVAGLLTYKYKVILGNNVWPVTESPHTVLKIRISVGSVPWLEKPFSLWLYPGKQLLFSEWWRLQEHWGQCLQKRAGSSVLLQLLQLKLPYHSSEGYCQLANGKKTAIVKHICPI